MGGRLDDFRRLALELLLEGTDGTAVEDPEPDGSRFLPVLAVGPCGACHGDDGVGAQELRRLRCHAAGSGFRDDRAGRHLEQIVFDRARVGDDGATEPVRRSGRGAQQARNLPTGQGFGGRDAAAGFGSEVGDLLCECVTVVAGVRHCSVIPFTAESYST